MPRALVASLYRSRTDHPIPDLHDPRLFWNPLPLRRESRPGWNVHENLKQVRLLLPGWLGFRRRAAHRTTRRTNHRLLLVLLFHALLLALLLRPARARRLGRLTPLGTHFLGLATLFRVALLLAAGGLLAEVTLWLLPRLRRITALPVVALGLFQRIATVAVVFLWLDPARIRHDDQRSPRLPPHAITGPLLKVVFNRRTLAQINGLLEESREVYENIASATVPFVARGNEAVLRLLVPEFDGAFFQARFRELLKLPLPVACHHAILVVAADRANVLVFQRLQDR
mmetsp:Transcript_22031/g.50757  ORF Transcript_22031/g.50757 Transcript_22031/m.50757 type:complete len:285 (-) Transcript_22031:1274-2128(-)